MLTRRRVIQVKIEAVKGTAETTGFSDVLVFDPNMRSTAPYEPRRGTGAYMGNNVKGVVGPRSGSLSCWAELRGNGSNGMDAGLAILLQGSGFLKTSEVYTAPSSPDANRKTVTIHYYEDGVRKVLYGASANVKIAVDEETKRIRCHFEFQGTYETITDVAIPAFAPGTQAPPIFRNGTFTIGAVAKRVDGWEIDLQNNLYLRPDGNPSGGFYCCEITDSDPQASFSIEHELVATYDIHAAFLAGTEAVLSIVVGSGAGDQITIAVPQMQYKEIPEGDRGGMLTYDVTAQLNNTASGDDAVTITVLAA